MVDAPLRRLTRLRPVVAGGLHALLATAVTVALAGWVRSRAGADGRPLLTSTDGGVDWLYYLLQGSGLTALVWSWAGLVIGLIAGSRRPSWLGRRVRLVTLHRQLSLAVLLLTLLHAVSSVVGLRGGSWLVSFVPQTSPTGALGWSAGILALYLGVLLGPTWYLRRWVPRRLWLLAHQAAALTYVLGLWHALVLGGDFRFEGTLRTVLWAAQLPVLVLLAARLLAPHRAAESPLHAGARTIRQRTLRDAAVLGVLTTGLALLLVVLTAVMPGLTDG